MDSALQKFRATVQQEKQTVSLSIGGKRFVHFSDFQLVQLMDGFSAASFSAPSEPSNVEFRKLFKPFSYQRVELHLGDELVFTGRTFNVEPEFDATSRNVTVTCYSEPQLISDCGPPVSQGHLEFNGMSLLDIAKKLCEPFGIQARLGTGVEQGTAFEKKVHLSDAGRTRVGSPLERVSIGIGDKILDFLSGLAKQRSLIITDDPQGMLVFTEPADAGHPVARFVEGEPPLLSVKPSFSPDDYYSEITVYTAKKRRGKSAKFTVENPHLFTSQGRQIALRPYAYKIEDIHYADAPTSVRTKLSRMFGNMVSWTLEVPTWLDPTHEHFVPNTTITLKAPHAMVYRETEMLIRKVSKSQDGDSTKAELEVVLAGSFDAEFLPQSLPWDVDEEAS